LKFKADFHSKMSVCRQELGGGFNPQPPRQFQLWSFSYNPSHGDSCWCCGMNDRASSYGGINQTQSVWLMRLTIMITWVVF